MVCFFASSLDTVRPVFAASAACALGPSAMISAPFTNQAPPFANVTIGTSFFTLLY